MFSVKKKESFLVINSLIGSCLILGVTVFFNSSRTAGVPELRLAAENMKLSLNTIQDYCNNYHINVGHPEDPLRTGLIGPEWSEITTTTGDPAAKRTTINPNFAALIAHLLMEAGVHQGDTIAIGSSASFPALLIASLSAARALGLCPVIIISLGSSSYGASNPDFNLWDIYRLLLDKKTVDNYPAAASMGGEDDSGSEFEDGITGRILQSLTDDGIPVIAEKDLQKNRSIREKYYFGDNPGRIKAFINSGGGFANIGSSPAVLNIKAGLVRQARMPEQEKQGMIHVMLAHKIPVIHLLFIKGLVQKYNLPWDPSTQPEITEQSVKFGSNRSPGVLIIGLAGLLWFTWFSICYRNLFKSSK